MLRPVHRLNSAVTELEATGRTGQLPEDGPPELRELSRSFTTMARTVSNSLESQRQLIADTSHELRNPVGALRLRIDLLQLELQTARQKDAAAGVLAELEHVEGILEGVLRLAAAEHRASEDSARSPAGARSPRAGRRRPIDPYPVLQEEAERADPAARRSGATILLHGPPEPAVHIACNPAELAQMVAELINNAIKYAPGAHISVGCPPASGRGVHRSVRRRPRAFRRRTGSGHRPVLALAAQPRHPRQRPGHDHRGQAGGANGGRLVLADASPHGLVARLEFPRRRRARDGCRRAELPGRALPGAREAAG